MIDFSLIRHTEKHLLSLERSGLLKRTRLLKRIPQITVDRPAWTLSQSGHDALQHLDNQERSWLRCVYDCSQKEGRARERSVQRHPVFSGYKDPAGVRYRIRSLVKKGWVEETSIPDSDTTSGYQLTDAGIREYEALRRDPNLASVRAPRVDQMGHHLLTAQVATLVVIHSGGELLRLEGDETMRSESRKGKRSRTRFSKEKLSDGRLRFRDSNNADRIAEIEILTSKYSDDVITAKYRDLPEHTIFAAPTNRLVRRTKRLTGRSPLLIRPDPILD